MIKTETAPGENVRTSKTTTKGISTSKPTRKHWVERIVFVFGTFLIFYAQFFISNGLNVIKNEQVYVERIVSQIQLLENTREHWLAQYNNSVSTRPQDRELIAMNAFKLLTSTDQLLTIVEISAKYKGKGDSQKLVDEKNRRFEVAESELKNGNAEFLVAETNKITEKHDKTVEPLTKIVMDDWRNKGAKADALTTRSRYFNLGGALLLALAFLMREYKDYQKA